jgi:hypothetical protein
MHWQSLGNHKHHALQRWRSITIEAIYKMNHNLESLFNIQFTKSIANLETVIQKTTSGDIILIDYDSEEHLQLIRIVKTARELSFKIQHGIVSCRLFVTIIASGDSEVNYDAAGTYAFGLERLAEGVRTVLLEAKVTTGRRLRSFVGY